MKYNITDLIGLLSDEEAEELKKYIKELRNSMRKEMEERFKKFKI